VAERGQQKLNQEATTLDLEEQLKRRVDEETVARILLAIATPPNRREEANPGDLSGNFDFWFDGGAARTITGWTEYEFEDGARDKAWRSWFVS